MHGFDKGPAPASLVDFIRAKTVGEARKLATVGWGELDAETNKAIRETLAERQGYLCAYCGSRIWPDAMRVEHWEPQQSAPEKRFDWENLLGVCSGGGRERGLPSHCDRRRGELALHLQTLHIKPDRDRARIGSLFGYSSVAEGLRIDAKERDAQRDVDITLALNVPVLLENRARALAAIKKRVLARFGDETLTVRYLTNLSRPSPSRGYQVLEPFLPALRPSFERWARKARP